MEYLSLFLLSVEVCTAMSDPQSINFQELERELAIAVAADQKYKRENDAKFRAIHQKVSSYEEFRDIVLASHLKPLEKKDKIGTERKQPWNPASTTKDRTGESTCTLLQESQSEPTNAFEFAREWRRLGVEKRYNFLLRLKADRLTQLFHTEVCSGLLGEILTALEENVQSTHQEEVLRILHSLANTQRFNLNLVFLSGAEVESCKNLFVKLQTFNTNEENLDTDFKREEMLTTLEALYKVNQ
ncbi:coiled-coil domain-containing 103 [Pelobates cultripes]|uniref:Coiled-coil domain-containing 103 n=2 Tax=Pelobates cultripes TaxID=61616 RepID=A0AAD1SJC4_PELCU|nr:coiled-coil domain-containing 103 [Pelobates cultripes]